MKMIFILFFLSWSAFADVITGKVVSIHDGDTLTFIPEGQKKKAILRLLGVDTPEVDFNGLSQGQMAREALAFLQSILPLNSIIQIELPKNGGVDVNGRYLGRVIYQGEDLNLALLKAGWGAMYFIYPYDKNLLNEYSLATFEASENGLGIFSSLYKNELLPYLFRQKTKGVEGTNIVGNFETKKLFDNSEITSVPHYQRVFFSSNEVALSRGFSW